jgi:hypothetical protein
VSNSKRRILYLTVSVFGIALAGCGALLLSSPRLSGIALILVDLWITHTYVRSGIEGNAALAYRGVANQAIYRPDESSLDIQGVSREGDNANVFFTLISPREGTWRLGSNSHLPGGDPRSQASAKYVVLEDARGLIRAYDTDEIHTGRLVVTRFDRVWHLVEGTFEFEAALKSVRRNDPSSGNTAPAAPAESLAVPQTIRVTSGSFKVRYWTVRPTDRPRPSEE